MAKGSQCAAALVGDPLTTDAPATEVPATEVLATDTLTNQTLTNDAHANERLTNGLLSNWHKRRRPTEFVVSLDALLRGSTGANETSELIGVGDVSPATIRDLLPDAFIKLVTLRGSRRPVVVCHAGKRVSTALLRALGVVIDPPPGDPDTVHSRPNVTVNIVLHADRVGDYEPAIGEIIGRRGKTIPAMVSPHQYINAHLRTALLVCGFSCSEPGCTTRGYLEIDHHIERSRGGPTAWHNLRYLCRHHRTEKTHRYNRGRYHPTSDRPTRDRRTSKAAEPASRRPAANDAEGTPASRHVTRFGRG